MPEFAFERGRPEAVLEHPVPCGLRRVPVDADPVVREDAGEPFDADVLHVGELTVVVAEALEEHHLARVLGIVHEELEGAHAVAFLDQRLLAEVLACGIGIDHVHLDVAVPVGGVAVVKVGHGVGSFSYRMVLWSQGLMPGFDSTLAGCTRIAILG